MQRVLSKASDIGPVVRAARKAQGLRQDDAAGAMGVSETLLFKLENGADGLRWDKLFQVLEGLGIRVIVDLPGVTAEAVTAELDKLERRRERATRRKANQALMPDTSSPTDGSGSTDPSADGSRHG